jgi:hypothetical protein
MPNQPSSPSSESFNKPLDKKQQKQLLIILALVVVALIGIGMMSSGTKTNPPAQPTVVNEPKGVFDVPSLVGKNMDEIIAVLGTPQYGKDPTEEQLLLGTTEWEKSWEKNGTDLMVTYDLKTKEVVDFFVSGVDPSGATKNKQLLLTASGATEGRATYKIEFVEALRMPGSYTGIKITPR